MLAGALDAALMGGAAWLWRQRPQSESERARRWTPPAELAADAFRQQLRSPGQLLFGLRTVDRRTGRRLELWRTLVVVGAGAARGMFLRRLAPTPLTPEQERVRGAFLEELNAIQVRHPDDAAAREAERQRLFARQHNSAPDILRRTAAPMLAIGLLHSRLRRRVAPTTEVLAGRGEDHNP
jgi:hypothetical protein